MNTLILNPLTFFSKVFSFKRDKLFIAPGLDVRLKNPFLVQGTIDPCPEFARGYTHSPLLQSFKP